MGPIAAAPAWLRRARRTRPGRRRHGLAGYLARRLVGTVLLLVVVTGLTFALIRLAPGDTAVTLAGSGGGDPAYLAALRDHLGLDRPLLEQVSTYTVAVSRGDLGFSVVRGRPVRDVLLDRLPATLLLVGTALAISTTGGILLGVVAAARQGTRTDCAIFAGSLLVYSLPVFWLGQLAVGLFAVRLRWLPTGGITSIASSPSGARHLLDVARHLVLPAGVLGLLLIGLVVRVTRAAMTEVLEEDYIRAARGRGVPMRRILFRHGLRNAVRPVVTVVTGQMGVVLTAGVLVETVFSWPGLGRLLLDSVLARDNPMLVGLLLFSSVGVALANLAADLLYAVVDPRVSYR